MRLRAQLTLALYVAPRAIGRLSARSWRLAGLYLLLAAGVLAVLGALLVSLEGGLRRQLIDWVLPVEVHAPASFLVDHVLASQTRQVGANALVAASLLLVSLVLFRVKERLSHAVELDHGLNAGRPIDEYPLWYQAFEEVRLLAVYGAAFIVTFWIGHDPAPWRGTLATVLSYLIVFFTWAVDFGAPILQRHRLRYAQVIRAVFRRPLASFGFGAVFSAPVILTAQLLAHLPDVDPVTTVALVFAVNVLAIVWAAIGGTWLGAALLSDAEAAPRAHPARQALSWILVLAILAGGAYVATSLALSLRDKSQVLKCRYDVDWSSLTVDAPALADLLIGEVASRVAFDVAITNPNELAVRIEENRLVVRDVDLDIAVGRLSPLAVPAGATVRTRVGLDARLDLKAFLRGARLDPARWDVILFLRLDDRFDFPVYLAIGDR